MDRPEFTLSDLLERLSAVSAQLLAAPADAVQIEIRRALEEVRELLQVDRCALYRAAPGRDAIDVACQATAPGVEPLPLTMGAAELFATSLAGVIRSAETLALHSLEALPKDAAGDRAAYVQVNIASLLAVPLFAAGAVRYVFCITSAHPRQEWPRDLVAGARLLGELVVGALTRKATYDAQQDLARFEALAAELKTRLAGATGERVAAEVDRGLEQLLAFFDVDMCGIIEVLRYEKQAYLRHVAHVPDVTALSTAIDLARAFPWKSQHLVRFGKAFIMNRIDDFPPEATVDRESIRTTGIKSSIDIPIATGGQTLHVFALACSRSERTFPEEYIPRLRLLGQAFADALSRARGEVTLRRAEQTLAAAQRIAQTGSYERDVATGEFTLSAEAQRIFGVQPGQNPTFLSCVHPEDRTKVEALPEPAVTGSEATYGLEYRIVRPDGEVRVIRDEGQMTSPQAGARRALGSIRDVTETRRTQQEMRELRMQLWHADRVARTGALSASLAHELRQPLAAILSNAQAALRLLARGEPDLKEIEQIVQDVVRNDKRAGGVIAGLQTMLRRHESERERVDLARAVKDLLSLVHAEAIAAQVEIEADLQTGVQVLADRTQVQQVVLNLVMNALEAMREQPADRRRLHVSVIRTEDGKGRCAVRDSGPGIAAEDLDKAFEAFRTTKQDGTGMGLSVCRSIVQAHEGEIWVERRAGPGATFVFELPAVQQGQRAVEQATPAEPHSGPGHSTRPEDATVFVVDDDAEVRVGLARLLFAAGWSVQKFASASELLDMPLNGATGCIVLDVQMPGMTGPQLHDLLRERGIDLPVVYLTAHGDVPGSVRAMKTGAVDFLLKPVDDVALLNAIHIAIERHAAVRAEAGAREGIEARMRRLSPREHVVMERVVLGHANKRIAIDLGITEDTVKVHRGRVMQKMQVRSLADLVRLCEKDGARAREPDAKA